MNEKILVAEDDRAIRTAVADLLASEGYEVTEAADGSEALELYREIAPDLVLLDVMMPGMSGYDVCRAIRRENPAVPVVMVTAKGQEVDRVVGLELGADDYIVKPFSMAELLARVRAALRRGALTGAGAKTGAPETLAFGDVTVDFAAMAGVKAGGQFALTPMETALLKFLAAREGRVATRETLLEEIWGVDCDVTTRTVDQHVARLRQKIEDDPSRPCFLLTAHGAGYRFTRGEGVLP
ncbi:MAG: response regulator transcription factor [Aminivibrio sp.]|jgi:DNA-binding response OmpR family regulator